MGIEDDERGLATPTGSGDRRLWGVGLPNGELRATETGLRPFAPPDCCSKAAEGPSERAEGTVCLDRPPLDPGDLGVPALYRGRDGLRALDRDLVFALLIGPR